MARVRYLGPEPVTVPELGRAVEPDEVVEVPDARFEGYVCQPLAWEAVEEPAEYRAPAADPEPLQQPQAEQVQAAPPAPAETPVKKTTAARPQKLEG
ncbi:hypothetical protein ABZ722_11730 [Streptomyces longwoodensis]|uniref:hypothetical protein n=1 Tax=Streptomyces longwoodensis TaxID=68231 RepID=UPI0033F12F4D